MWILTCVKKLQQLHSFKIRIKSYRSKLCSCLGSCLALDLSYSKNTLAFQTFSGSEKIKLSRQLSTFVVRMIYTINLVRLSIHNRNIIALNAYFKILYELIKLNLLFENVRHW